MPGAGGAWHGSPAWDAFRRLKAGSQGRSGLTSLSVKQVSWLPHCPVMCSHLAALGFQASLRARSAHLRALGMGAGIFAGLSFFWALRAGLSTVLPLRRGAVQRRH